MPATGRRPDAGRAQWLDALRGLAVLGMIETHTVNTLMAASWKSGDAFTRLVYWNGLVAPAFLWIAGYAHGLGSAKRSADPAAWDRTVRRLLVLLLLGYLIHLPVPGTGATWPQFFGIDVLQCLAASLLAAAVVERWAGAWAQSILATMTVVVVALGAVRPGVPIPAPLLWPLRAWIDQSGVSLFPVIPWAAFVFLGVLMAPRRWAWWVWALIGAALVALPSPPYQWKSQPAFFVERFGWLLVGAAAIRGLGECVGFPRWLRWVGRESLPLYLVHLGILYLLPTTRWVGARLDPAATAAAAIVLTLASAALVWGWRRLWARHGGSEAPMPRPSQP